MSVTIEPTQPPGPIEGGSFVAFPTAFGKQCERTPHATAIVSDAGTWTYQQLDQAADNIAAELLRSGGRHGTFIGMCVDRSVEAIATMIGIMKIGGVFVPLDPEYPIDRLRYMVADGPIEIIVGHGAYRSSIGGQLAGDGFDGPRWLDADQVCNQSRESTPGDALVVDAVNADDLAYIMYTSGSTGKPKGVQIQHLALAAYCDADIDRYLITADDRTLQFSTLNFDIAIEEIFPPLLTGGCVVVRPRERAASQNELSTLIERFEVTAVHLATAYWHEWIDLMVATGAKIPRSLRLMIVTGEKVSVAHYRRWQQLCDHDVLWCNAYGPTEATVSATVFIPDEDFDAANMPIGIPLKRYTAHILDDQHRPVEVGQTGELFLGGPALAMGYHRRPELTEAAFQQIDVDGQPQRLYRTGDLARWLPDGNIDFGGRVDHQIKVGSYRIEPAEIEAVINEFDAVLESLVTYEEIDGKKFMVAFVATGENAVSAFELASFLRDRLPPYMIPARYLFMDAFPTTINGKIDRRALPPASRSVAAASEDSVAPRTDLEKQLAAVWQEVLNVSTIGVHDDFFLLGGSSLLVTRVVARLTTDLAIELPVRDFFANPTIATAARHIESLLGRTVDQTLHQADLIDSRSRLPHVHADFIPSGANRLYGVWYRPRQKSHSHTIVICHSIGHEYSRGYRNLNQLAVQLSKSGYDVLRFDYASTGNSSGDCGDLSIESMRADLRRACEYMATQTGNPATSVIGLRWGAAVVAGLSEPDFDQVVLWDPVTDGKSFLAMVDRFHDQEMGAVMRFNQVRRRGSIDQAYGHRMTGSKRTSLGSVDRDSLGKGSANWTVVLTDRADSSPESHLPTEWAKAGVRMYRVGDSIIWNDPRFAESAFSSPESFSHILECFQADP